MEKKIVAEILQANFKRGKELILKEINLSIYAGELLVLVGANGSGKTTLLSLLSGLLPVDSGEILIQGKSISSWTPLDLACHRAVLSQEQFLNFPFSVNQVVKMGRYPYEKIAQGGKSQYRKAEWMSTPQENNQLVERTLEQLNLNEISERQYTTLSGGQKQLTHLGRVLTQIQGPPAGLLLLDEPSAALDLHHQELLFRQILSQIKKGTAGLMILHDLNVALRYADRIAVLKEGEIISIGKPEEALMPKIIKRAFSVEARRIEYEKEKFIIF